MKQVFNSKENILVGKLLEDYFHNTTHKFDYELFVALANKNIEQLELKERSEQIVMALDATLPSSFASSCDALDAILQPIQENQDLREVKTSHNGVAGWMIMPFTEYVGRNGAGYIDRALQSLKLMTQRFSSEFGIRHLLMAQPFVCLKAFQHWVNDPCHHVRRLVSEGTRPLLPWAMQLPKFKANPSWVLPLLEALKADRSEYVRRSVANHLNDISKHHPNLVNSVARRWMSESACVNRKRLVKHACRTLIKQGNPETLAIFGYASPTGVECKISLDSEQVTIGDSLKINLVLDSQQTKPLPLLLDYKVYHLRSNGKHTEKVFKWKELVLGTDSIELNKVHSFKRINTRRYYQGQHYVEVLINGKALAKTAFQLIDAS